jgi:hypothetical protein
MTMRRRLCLGAAASLLAASVIAGCATPGPSNPHAAHGGWGDRADDGMAMKCDMGPGAAASAAATASAPDGGMKHCMTGMMGHGGGASAPAAAASGAHAGH